MLRLDGDEACEDANVPRRARKRTVMRGVGAGVGSAMVAARSMSALSLVEAFQALARTSGAVAQQMLQPNEQTVIKVFQKSTAGVVFINTFIQDRMDMFSMDATEVPAGTGSGFVWDKEGHIVTNFHVIRTAQKARVTISDPESNELKTFEAQLIGYDPDKDIAVLKVEAPKSILRPLTTGSSSDLLVGQDTIAIGNPFGLDHTLTTGVVSGLGRQVMSPTGRPIFNVIQTDASINPGNSGGPLLNSAGQIIGINTAIFSPSGASSGVGFAIPIDTVKQIVATLITKGQILRPQLGVALFDTQALKSFGIDIPGVAILEVAVDSPAEEAGLMGMSRTTTGDLRVGDIITAFDGVKIKNESDVYRLLEKYEPGDVIDITVVRGGKETRSVKLKLGAAKRAPIRMSTAAPAPPLSAPATQNSGPHSFRGVPST